MGLSRSCDSHVIPNRGESLAKVKGVVQQFDWTFTTDYSGTLLSTPEATLQVSSISWFLCHWWLVLPGGGDK